MDHPTQSIATYLENKFQYLLDPENSDLSEKFQELYEFGAKCFDKYYGERISSDTYVVKETSFTSKENSINQVMIVLLMDEQQYGC